MVDRLSEEERKIINENWDTLKEEVLKSSRAEITKNGLTIKAEKKNNKISLMLIEKNKKNALIKASINSKIMIFKIQEKGKKVDKNELIYESSSIIYFINHFKMQHPIFKKKEKNEILDKSVTEENVNEIFSNPDIKEIIDDSFESYIIKEDFINFIKDQKEISDYYDKFSLNNYSDLAQIITQKSKEMKSGNGRNDLIEFLSTLNLIKDKIIILAGAQKIGITFSVLEIVNYYSILYLDLYTMFSLTKSDKRKYVFNRFINLFRDYNDYYNFIVKNILKLQGYENILSIFENMISNISKELKNIIIIIDNYDDYLVGDKKLSSDYLDKIYSIIEDTNIKIVFIGKGKFISNLLIDSFYDKANIKKYILFKYFQTLDLNIENIIHSYYKDKQMNEIELYYNKNKENNLESVIPNLLIIKNMRNIIGKDFRNNFPFQFFRFNKKENENLQIEYQFDDLINLNNIKLRKYMAELNNITLCYEKTSPSVKGFLFEELVITFLMNNKSGLKNLTFTKKNIIEVESIYQMNNIKKVENLEKGPILIIQEKNGEVFDFGIIIDYNYRNYFIGGQIGINKTNKEISSYQEKISSSHNKILEDLNTLTGRKIEELKFIIILNKEWQNSLRIDYEEKHKKILDFNNKLNEKIKLTKFEIEENNKIKKEISYFNSQYGIKCCENWNISYLLFSDKELCFYTNENKIEFFNAGEIKSFKTGFELFCIKEYNLIPYSNLEQILNEKEKEQLINKLKEIYSDIKDIEINYKINGKINLLPATPENYGILSIYNDLKIFTYFEGKFIVFIIHNGKITRNENLDNITNYPFENDDLLERYFVELIYDDENEINIKEEKDDNKKEKKDSEIEVDEDKDNNVKVDEFNNSLKNKVNRRKDKQKNESFQNHIKYLNIKRKRGDN